MPNCPNCGQPTKRTEDWACQLCGYPLLSKSYGKISKTFKQLKALDSNEQAPHSMSDTMSAKIELTAEELFTICKSYQKEKDTIFNNRILSVTGLVTRTEVDHDNDIYFVVLTGPQKNKKSSVRCIFYQKDKIQLKDLIVGQIVTIEGKYDSFELDTILKDCKLVNINTQAEISDSQVSDNLATESFNDSDSEKKLPLETKQEREPDLKAEIQQKEEVDSELANEPDFKSDSITLKVTIDELLAAYSTDGKEADERFRGKTLEITGIVNRIEVKDYLDTNYINLTSIELNTLDHIRCFFDKKHEFELNQLTKGQRVTVKGTYDGSLINMRLIKCVLLSANT